MNLRLFERHLFIRISSIFLLIALALTFFGAISFRKQYVIPHSAITKDIGHAWSMHIGLADVTPLGQLLDIRLLEDGKELGPKSNPHDNIRQHGRGLYDIWYKDLFFSTSDNTSPLDNSRTYTLTFLQPLPSYFVIGIILFPILCNFGSIAKFCAWLQRSNPHKPALILATVALIYRIAIWWLNPNAFVDGHLVLGMPFSDGRGWDTLVWDFAQGRLGEKDSFISLWGARRPLHYLFFGSIYALTGSHIVVTFAIKIVFGIICTIVIWDAGRRIIPAPVAFTGALYQATLYPDAIEAIATRSEGLGYFWGVLAVWLFIVALDIDQKDNKVFNPSRYLTVMRFFFSGVFLALSNLARTLNLGAVIGLPLLAFWVTATKSGQTFHLKRSLCIKLSIFILGFCTALAPWLCYQKFYNGIFSISDNSAQMLYAATHPDYVTWDSRITNLFSSGSLKERFDFYTNGYKENLKKYPDFYWKNALSFAWAAVTRTTPPIWPLFITTILFVCCALCDGKYSLARITLTSLVLGGLIWSVFSKVSGLEVYWIWLIGMVWAVIERAPIALLLGTVAPSIAAIGACAFVDDRGVYPLLWCSNLFSAWTIYRLLALFLPNVWRAHSFSTTKAEIPSTIWPNGTERLCWRTGNILALTLMIGTCVAIYNSFDSTKTRTPQEIPESERQMWIAKTTAKDGCKIYHPLFSKLEVRRGFPRKRYAVTLEPRQFVSFWSTLFSKRDYKRTIFELYPPNVENYSIIPSDREFVASSYEIVLIGLSVSHPDPRFEVIDAFRLDRAGNVVSSFNCGQSAVAAQHRAAIDELIREREGQR